MPQLTIALKNRVLDQHVMGASTRIGRDPEMDVVIANVGVSRHHATVFYDGDCAVIHDENSANGVFVNGTQVQRRQLLDGDVIQIGKFTLSYRLRVDPRVLAARAANDAAPPSSESGPKSKAARPRDMMKTFAMSPDEVQKLLGSAARGAAPTAVADLDEEEEAGVDPAVKIVGGGLLIITVLATALYFAL